MTAPTTRPTTSEAVAEDAAPMNDLRFEREWSAVGARVAIANAAVKALDDAIRSLRLQRKAAEARHVQRLNEHTEFLLAHGDRIRANLDARRTGSRQP